MTSSRTIDDFQTLHAIARRVRDIGWLLGFVILVVGTVLAARAGAEIALFLRLAVAGAVVAFTSAVAWLISRYADRRAARQARPQTR
jgi:4-hydroxybenzoate polyprenyltransferase